MDSLTGMEIQNRKRQIRGKRFREYSIADKKGINKMLKREHSMMSDWWIDPKREDLRMPAKTKCPMLACKSSNIANVGHLFLRG